MLSFIKHRLAAKFRHPKTAEWFYNLFFAMDGSKRIIQVGANDGEMSDPLRAHLEKPGSYTALLVEPVPFYADKLRRLYEGRTDIRIEQVACGSVSGELDFFMIPPEVADDMNGDGPPNNWAHGQGSFDKDVIIYWIRRNGFRGEQYRAQIPRFIDSIQSTKIPVIQLSVLQGEQVENLLLVIDVQGFELQVLQGVDWDHPPAFIVYEDDRHMGAELRSLLKRQGYRYLLGTTDRVYCREGLKIPKTWRV